MRKRIWLSLLVLALFVSACASLRPQAVAPGQGAVQLQTTPTPPALAQAQATPSTPATTVDVTPTPGAQVTTPTAVTLDLRTSTSGLNQALSDAEASLVDVYKRVSPAVVYIETDNGSGSGFVVDKDGHIVTNNHVIEGAGRIEIVFANRTRAQAQVVGRDADADVAVLKVDVPADQLVVAELGDSSTVQVGQFAIAIGNPFGLQNTMTLGVISGLGRTLQSIALRREVRVATPTRMSSRPMRRSTPATPADRSWIRRGE